MSLYYAFLVFYSKSKSKTQLQRVIWKSKEEPPPSTSQYSSCSSPSWSLSNPRDREWSQTGHCFDSLPHSHYQTSAMDTRKGGDVTQIWQKLFPFLINDARLWIQENDDKTSIGWHRKTPSTSLIYEWIVFLVNFEKIREHIYCANSLLDINQLFVQFHSWESRRRQ